MKFQKESFLRVPIVKVPLYKIYIYILKQFSIKELYFFINDLLLWIADTES